VRIEGLEHLAWAHMFMEGARKLGASFFVLESSCLVEGASLQALLGGQLTQIWLVHV